RAHHNGLRAVRSGLPQGQKLRPHNASLPASLPVWRPGASRPGSRTGRQHEMRRSRVRNKSIGGTAVGLIAALAFAGGAHAHHATPTAEVTTGDCGEVTITTAWSDDVADRRVDTAAQ